VVPGNVHINHPSDKVRHRSFKKRDSPLSYEWDLEGVLRTAREMIAQQFLMLRKHAYAEAARTWKNAMHVGSVVYGNNDKRRRQRGRHKGIGSHAVRAIVVHSRNDGDAGSESP
jgi:hypothetical protein